MFAEGIFPWIVLDFNTSKNWVDYFAALGPTVMAFIAICVAAWQLYVSNKQKNINQQQIEFAILNKVIDRCIFL